MGARPFLEHSFLRNLTIGGRTVSPCGPSTSDLRTASTARRDSRSSYSGYVSNRHSRMACRSALTSATAFESGQPLLCFFARIAFFFFLQHSQSSATWCCRAESSAMRRLVELVMSFCRRPSRLMACGSASPFAAMSSSPHEQVDCGVLAGLRASIKVSREVRRR